MSATARAHALGLYRALLRAARRLPDEFAARVILLRVRYEARRAAAEGSVVRVAARVRTAEQAVSTLERAADGERAALRRVLEHAYGVRGRLRHMLNAPFEIQRVLVSDVIQPVIPPRTRGAKKADRINQVPHLLPSGLLLALVDRLDQMPRWQRRMYIDLFALQPLVQQSDATADGRDEDYVAPREVPLALRPRTPRSRRLAS